jgi:hypothetical protein
MLRRVALVRTDILFLPSFLRLLVTANVLPISPILFTLMMQAIQQAQGVASKNMAFFISPI